MPKGIDKNAEPIKHWYVTQDHTFKWSKPW